MVAAISLAACSSLPSVPSRTIQTIAKNNGGGTTSPSPSPSPSVVAYQTDSYGDTATEYSNDTATIVSYSTVGPSSFNASLFLDDFGTYNVQFGYNAPGFMNTRTIKPRSSACDAALSKLNTNFLGFMASIFPFLFKFQGSGAPWIAGKINPTKGGLFFGWTAAIRSLNSDQSEVNTQCRGQGAGQFPYG